MANEFSSHIIAMQDLQSRFHLSEEDAEELIQNHFFSDEHGRSVFDSIVLKRTDYTNSRADGTDGSYIVCRLRPLFYHQKLLPWPCSLESESAQMCAVSLHPIGKSESMAQNVASFPLQVGDTVTCYYSQGGPADNGKLRVLNFYLDRKRSTESGNYSFDCLDKGDTPTSVVLKKKKYSTSLPPNTGPCQRYVAGSSKGNPQSWKATIDGIKAYNGRFDRIPNSPGSYRGGHFHVVNYEKEMINLIKSGVHTIIRLNAETRARHIGSTKKGRSVTVGTQQINYAGGTKGGLLMEQAEWNRIAKANGVANPKFFYYSMGGRAPTSSVWDQMKDMLVQGGVYLHCTHGVDRTGTVATRWVMETEASIRGISVDDIGFKNEMWEWNKSFSGYQWVVKPADKEDDPQFGKKGKSRTALRDACANKKLKEWMLGIDTGYHSRYLKSPYKVKADPDRARQVLSRCR